MEALQKLKRDISLSVIDLTTVHDIVYDVAVYTIPGCRTIILSAVSSFSVNLIYLCASEVYFSFIRSS